MNDYASDVKSFLTANKMKQNDDKTEFVVIGTPSQHIKVEFNDLVSLIIFDVTILYQAVSCFIEKSYH